MPPRQILINCRNQQNSSINQSYDCSRYECEDIIRRSLRYHGARKYSFQRSSLVTQTALFLNSLNIVPDAVLDNVCCTSHKVNENEIETECI